MRGNNVSSKVMKFYTDMTGHDFVIKMLAPIVKESLPDNMTSSQFELDPIKLTNQEDLTANQGRLLNLCDQFVSHICQSADSAPGEIREICHHIHNVVSKKFPESRITAVGAFIFLRGVCPAIVTPHVYGVTQRTNAHQILLTSLGPPNKETQRVHTLVAKVIQNMANNVKFGKKEEYMTVMNEFIEQKLPTIQQFLQDLAVIVRTNCSYLFCIRHLGLLWSFHLLK
jgi:neurofibromin 1